MADATSTLITAVNTLNSTVQTVGPQISSSVDSASNAIDAAAATINNAKISAQNASISAQNSAAQAVASAAIASAYASAAGIAGVFTTKASADASVGAFTDGQYAEVLVDETQGNARTVYKKVTGAWVYQTTLDRLFSAQMSTWLTSLPTSPVALGSGEWWNNGGVPTRTP